MDSITISREELYKKIWELSPTKAAKELDVSYKKMKAACDKADIPYPERGEKREKPWPPLPDSEIREVELPLILHHETRNDGTLFSPKAYLFCLYNLLFEHSDADHILSRAELQRQMQLQYGLEIDRRTIYSAMFMLDQMGYDISDFEENGQGYYLKTRTFEESEVRALMDAVFSSPSFPKTGAKDLIGKLQSTLPAHKRKKYENLLMVPESRRTDNVQLFYNIEIIDEAISEKKMVKFTYLRYDINKKLVPRRKWRYRVSPYALLAANEGYYLLCKSEGYENISSYRLDKIADIVKTDEPYSAPPENFDPGEYANKNLFMYGGESIKAEFRCKNDVLEHVIDRFGDAACLSDNGDNTFTLKVEGSLIGLKIWALHFTDSVEAVGPAELREAVIEAIENNMYGV